MQDVKANSVATLDVGDRDRLGQRAYRRRGLGINVADTVASFRGVDLVERGVDDQIAPRREDPLVRPSVVRARPHDARQRDRAIDDGGVRGEVGGTVSAKTVEGDDITALNPGARRGARVEVPVEVPGRLVEGAHVHGIGTLVCSLARYVLEEHRPRAVEVVRRRDGASLRRDQCTGHDRQQHEYDAQSRHGTASMSHGRPRILEHPMEHSASSGVARNNIPDRVRELDNVPNARISLRCLNRDPDLSLHRHRGISESRSASMPNCWQTIMRPSATASSPTTAEKLAPMATPSSPLSPHPRPAWRRRSKCSTCSPDTRGLVRSARACAGPKCEHRPTG